METQQTSTDTGKRKPWGAWSITEKKGFPKPFWNKIGVAFLNRDGSFTIHLDSLPVNGVVHIREDRERDHDKQRGELGRSAETAVEAGADA